MTREEEGVLAKRCLGGFPSRVSPSGVGAGVGGAQSFLVRCLEA